MFRKENGVTLVALVITIIVLLILAGVTIAMLTGDNGLLTRASSTVPNQEVAGAKDEVSLAYQDAFAEYLDNQYTGTAAEKAKTLTSIFSEKINAITTNGQNHNCTISLSGTTLTITSGSDSSVTATGTFTDAGKATGSSFTWN